MANSTPKKHLKNLLRRIYPKASITPHKLGVAFKLPDQPTQLICCMGAVVKPFHAVFTTKLWDAQYLAAAKLDASLSYAILDELGTSARVLPLSAIDRHDPNWKTVETASLYDEEDGEYHHEEVVRVPLAVGNTATVPEHRLTEYELEATCVAWAREHHPEVLVWHVPNEACVKRWRHYELQGVTRGVPDMTCVFPGGKVVFVEFKTRTGVLSDAQADVGQRMKANGSLYVVVRTQSEFAALFAADRKEASRST